MGSRLADEKWRRACYCDRAMSMAMSGLSVDGVVCPMVMWVSMAVWVSKGCCEFVMWVR